MGRRAVAARPALRGAVLALVFALLPIAAFARADAPAEGLEPLAGEEAPTGVEATLAEEAIAGEQDLFYPVLAPVFHPINRVLAPIPQPWWTLCALALFIGTMIWAFAGLKREYLALDAPGTGPLYDLRLWVVVSMLPHVIAYLYFT
jgi:hypothetical protein